MPEPRDDERPRGQEQDGGAHHRRDHEGERPRGERGRVDPRLDTEEDGEELPEEVIPGLRGRQ